MAEKTSFGETLLGLGILAVMLAIPCWFIWAITPDSIRYPFVYQFQYDVKYDDVHVDKRPNDCEWGHAPIGDKDCHYEKFVSYTPALLGQAAQVFVTWEKKSE